MAKRFWFKTSELYMKGPFTLVGVLASSWDEAKEVAIRESASRALLCLPCGWLHANVIDVGVFPCSETATVVVRLPEPETRKPGLKCAPKRTRTRARKAA